MRWDQEQGLDAKSCRLCPMVVLLGTNGLFRCLWLARWRKDRLASCGLSGLVTAKWYPCCILCLCVHVCSCRGQRILQMLSMLFCSTHLKKVLKNVVYVYVCVRERDCVAWVNAVCAGMSTKARRGNQIPCSWSCRWL